MCGVLGYISKTGEAPDEGVFTEALARQKYRGPDGTRIEQVQPNSLFGFNRLAIQDLSEEGMQPFHYGDNRLVFNGEIYNWKELRADLEREHGVSFSTKCDTEVLCVGLSIEGSSFVKKLNGIFAFCFWNEATKSYLVARDLMGVKPLFYGENEKGFALASDINALLEYIQPQIDLETLQLHAFTDVFAGHDKVRTFFKGIRAFKNGYITELSAQGALVGETAFAELDFHTTKTSVPEIEREFADKLATAFQLETRSDVPIGIFLSGGIDSTTITALATPDLLEQQKKIPVFTYAFEEKGENADYLASQQVLAQLKEKYGDVFDHHYLNLDTPLTEEDFLDSCKARAMPVSDYREISSIKQYRDTHKQNLKVVLNGQGSDELYYGYYPLDYWISRFFRIGNFTTEELIAYYQKDQNKLKHSAYKAEFLEAAEASTRRHFDKLLESIPADLEKEKQIADFFTDTILQALLLREDKGGMYSSIEVRVPLINTLLTQYVSGTDFKAHLVSSTSGRHLLRKAIGGLFSSDVVARPKSPAPKKKQYWDELYQLYLDNKVAISSSALLDSVYTPAFLNDPATLKAGADGYSFYGNADDVLLEMLGLFFFEKEYLM